MIQACHQSINLSLSLLFPQEEALDHIILYATQRLGVVLSMTVLKITNLQLSKAALQALRRDFEACAPVLRAMEVDPANEKGSKNARERFAAVWWLLMKKLEPSDSVPYVDEDLQILLKKDIKVNLTDQGQGHGEAANSHLMEKVSPSLWTLLTASMFSSP